MYIYTVSVEYIIKHILVWDTRCSHILESFDARVSCDCTSKQYLICNLACMGLVVDGGHEPTNYTQVIPVKDFTSYSQLMISLHAKRCELFRLKAPSFGRGWRFLTPSTSSTLLAINSTWEWQLGYVLFLHVIFEVLSTDRQYFLFLIRICSAKIVCESLHRKADSLVSVRTWKDWWWVFEITEPWDHWASTCSLRGFQPGAQKSLKCTSRYWTYKNQAVP